MNDPSPGKWKEIVPFSFMEDFHAQRLHTSEASVCDVSEQLKQDGGSSRGSGEGVWIVVPIGTSRKSQHINSLVHSYTIYFICVRPLRL